MGRRKNYQLAAAGCMLVVSLAYSFGSEAMYQGLAASSQGTSVDISGIDAASYGVEGVWLQKDGSYVLNTSMEGFGGSISVAVNMDKTGNIQEVKVLAHMETPDIGSKIEEGGFLNQFNGIKAPVRVGDMEVVSPGSGTADTKIEDSVKEVVAVMDSSEWNKEDKSPEAEAARKMYDTGLLQSGRDGEELTSAAADGTAEERAQKKLVDAGLTKGTVDKTAPEPAKVVASTGIDAVSGATISSEAVGKAVNQAYYFIADGKIK